MTRRRAPSAAPAALAGRRVLELADEKGVYCGKLLADMGADVVKIERPGGDPARRIPPFWKDRARPDTSLFFLYMNTSKRSVTLDIESADGQKRLRELVRGADLVIETFSPGRLDSLGLGFEALREINPRLVWTSITGFGQTGPQAQFRGADLVASALGGAMVVTGEQDDPPVTLAGSQAYVMASTFAAVSSLIALHHAARSGRGQRVDISALETTASVSHICGVGKWLDDGIVPRRRGAGLFASVPSGTYRCSDGLVYLMVNRPLHWQVLARWVSEETGNREVLDPMFEGPSSRRIPHRELLDLFISELTRRHSVREMYEEGQRRHLAFTPVNCAEDVTRDPHLAARGYFVSSDHPKLGSLTLPGAPYRHTRTPWRIARPAPSPGEHSVEVLRELKATLPEHRPEAKSPEPEVAATPQALSDLRVVEFSSALAGPWIGRLMAFCGADVIRAESLKRPDVVRLYVSPREPERGTQPRCSPWFTDWNSGKRFVGLDLTHPEAVALAKRLVAQCDVVVENQSAGVMDKLGLGYEELLSARPDLIMLSSSGYGDSGPNRRYVTWGPNIEALSGLSRVSGFPGRECTMTQYAYPDTLSALHGLFAVLCALDHRARTGEGQHISLSQLEATVSVIGHVLLEQLANGSPPPQLGNQSRQRAPHGCYRCLGEDRWCAIAISDEAEWGRLCAVLGQTDWPADPRFATLAARLENADALDRGIENWTRQRDAYEVMRVLQEARVAAGVVQTAEDQLRRDPQLAARGFFEEIEHLAKDQVVAPGIPLGLTGTPGRSGRSGAGVGEDNDRVFGDLLGLSPQQIQRLVDVGAIERAPD